jgi:DNA-directed RNA polymerase specialized sigma24 family protein
MGSVKIDTHAKERSLEAKYPALDNSEGVRLLLGDYHALRERQYAGDYDAVVILADLATAIERASLTNRQRQAVELVYFDDLTQVDAANRMGCSKQTVNRLTMVSLTKIARVYEKWARYGEGYALGSYEEGIA